MTKINLQSLTNEDYDYPQGCEKMNTKRIKKFKNKN